MKKEKNDTIFDNLLLCADKQQAQIYQEQCPEMQCLSINLIAKMDSLKVLHFGVSPGLYTQCQYDAALMKKLKTVTRILNSVVRATRKSIEDASASVYLPEHSAKR
ncbi:hypothetical protein [Lacticaseibacillus mingshuiensis]|uniref:Uncharacterized protein n=1 Tax=Lacticaseibacillus mingshuiensis TaxID=2799574 RepID=A0ABW4CJ42_9LACO|nr:hypothetical protein [Lacticaseibacillus mingshuiensis]